MTNLINAITAECKQGLETFIAEINNVEDVKGLHTWQYKELLPKGKKVDKMSLTELRAYLIERKQKAVYKDIERQVNHIKAVFNAGELIEAKVSIEWKKSAMWGSNPKAEAWATYKDADGNTATRYAQSGSISGCGYDKQSTAVADCLNQFNEVLKLLYTVKENNPTYNNNELLGYGAGYGILPRIEGGVGISCYPRIFEPLGYKFSTVASGKTYDVYTITIIN